jgi:threonylcarbamoyladenosine tRNA methylthiotransferase MtaB
MKFHIFTSGCKANQWDSHVIASQLSQQGMGRASMQNADLIVINACSLTVRAETDVRRFVQRARQVNPAAKIVLAGCHAQVYPDRCFDADLILGQEEKFRLAQLYRERGTYVTNARTFPMEKAAVDVGHRERTRFFFKGQDGCNRFCTYCVVPYARGAVRSRPLTDIAATMKALKDKGVKEVVLTGIDVAAYRDPESGSDLKELLVLFESMETPPRIRLSSVDPQYMDDAFIDVLASCRKLAKSIHIPVQSGSDAVLARMGRRYNSAFVARLVEKLKRIGTIGIGIDILVGFPGESDEAFLETYRLIEKLDVYYLHVFPYSEREGTKACGFDGKGPQGVRKERVRKLKVLDAEKREAFLRGHIGRTAVIIPEGKVYEGKYMRGYADDYVPVHIPYEKRLENNLVNVTIKDMQGIRLIGGL